MTKNCVSKTFEPLKKNECSEHVTAAHIWTKEVTNRSVAKKKKQSAIGGNSKKAKCDITLSAPSSSTSTSQRLLVCYNWTL